MKKAIAIILIVVLAGGFIFGAFMLIKTLVTAENERRKFESVVNIIDSEKGSEINESTGTLRKYDPLYLRNKDFFGWLKIEDTKIDYPVMYTPGDNEYYLHRDFDGNYSESGCLFIDGACPEKGNYYLIYGHHMINGSMFGDLPKYQSYDFYKEHKKIFFDTRYELRDYEVVAAFYAEVYDVSEEQYHFCYYKYADLSDPNTFNEYVSNVKAMSVYDTGITPVYGDDLIALSTCNYHTEDGRFVVVARRITDKKPAVQ